MRTLVELANEVYKKLNTYPEFLQTKFQDTLQKTRLIFCLHGKTPFMNQCSIEDLDNQLPLKKEHFIKALTEAGSVHKQRIDAAWGLNASEASTWGEVSELIDGHRTGKTDGMKYVSIVLKKLPG